MVCPAGVKREDLAFDVSEEPESDSASVILIPPTPRMLSIATNQSSVQMKLPRGPSRAMSPFARGCPWAERSEQRRPNSMFGLGRLGRGVPLVQRTVEERCVYPPWPVLRSTFFGPAL